MTALIVAVLAGVVGFFAGRRVGRNEVKAELLPVLARTTDALENITGVVEEQNRRGR